VEADTLKLCRWHKIHKQRGFPLPSFFLITYFMSVQAIDRIESTPDILSGQPVVKGTRLPVYVFVEAIAEGDSIEELKSAYPFLNRADIQQAPRLATRMSQLENFEE